MKQPSIALLYDWVTAPHGGAERVLLALHQAFPEAPLFTSVVNRERVPWSAEFDLRPSWLQRLPWLNRHHRWLAPLLPLGFESLDLTQFQVVISITSAEAKGVLTRPDQLHLCYLLTPPRYLYSHSQAYEAEQFSNVFLRWLAQPFLAYLRWWDQAAAYRPDVLIPISNLVSQRSQEYYDRKTQVALYPPVLETKSSEVNETSEGDYYLVVSRLVPYKRIDLAIEACLKLGRSLVIIGEGPDRDRLRTLAGKSQLIQFLGSQPDSEVSAYMNACRAVLMPGLEDFGIAAAEAVALGKPVVVHHQSGVAEILSPGKTAIFLESDTLESMTKALRTLEKTPFNPSQLRQSMRKYATTTFVKKWQQLVLDQWALFQEKGFYER